MFQLQFSLVTTALLTTLFISGVYGNYSESFEIFEEDSACVNLIRDFNPLLHKQKYRIGVYANEGNNAAFRLYNMTYVQYLTATAGQRFNPPIEFEMVPVNLNALMVASTKEELDFFFATPAVFSCMATEYKSQALATIINRREARGHTFDLDVYGGVMFTLASNDEVNSIQDFKGRTIGAGGITMMGGAQAQFYEMFANGLSYVADPSQVVFTMDERKTVQGVLDGCFEIGFARTDQIERHQDANGKDIDPELFKVINPQIHVLDDGQLFPFVSSTGLVAEWAFAALDHVSRDVSKEVQEALFALQDHAESIELEEKLRCDTTPEIAELALAAQRSGSLVGFRTARSYFDVRTKQEAAGFLMKNEKGNLECIKGETLYHDIRCPADHYKLTEADFEASCEKAGKECKNGYLCYCKPCVKAYEVDIFQYHPGEFDNSTEVYNQEGCDKMSLCAQGEQTKHINLRLVDNRKRENPEIQALMHISFQTVELPVKKVSGKPYVYDIEWSYNQMGMGILEVHFDSIQIPQSPVRVQITDRLCDVDFPGQRRKNTADGKCACGEGSMEIRGKCVESTVVAVIISIGAVFLIGVVGAWYVDYRNRKNDEMWQITVDELQFDDPPEVIGQGSFGVVLLGRYRGTTVALKRALKINSKGSRHGSKSRRGNSKGRTYGSSQGSRSRNNNNGSTSMTTINSDENGPDPELGQAPTEEEANQSLHSTSQTSQSAESNSNGRSGSRGGAQSRSNSNNRSLGFLAEDFGHGAKWGWLFPWVKRNDYHSRFKDAILGGTGSATMNTRTFHAIFCPWFNAQVRAELDFIQEMRVLSRLRHPCITTVLGAVISRSHDPMLVMEYMEYGSLHDLLQNETMYLSGEIILQISRDLAQGLRFLHSSKPPILHGDMKARNVLVDSRFRAKLCDFGLSTKKTNLITGTPYWLAPEYLRGQTGYTTECDIYSVGIILYEIYARQDPYKGEDFRETLRKVCDRRVNKRPTIPPTCPPKMVEMMKKCWSPDPFFRPQAKDLDTTFLDWSMRDAEPLVPSDAPNQTAVRERPTGDMLYELFPKHVADQLKAGQKVEPEQHEEVTVVFSDIVHFTDISRSLSPLKVSNMLDRLYLAFDRVARKNTVFKVETIGDAYMGVTNLEKKQTDTHAKHAALFAIDLVHEASQILIDEEDPSKGYVNIRVGFHSGPVVSNVIGSLNPRYGLFGDTVNTASRMESNSKANRILCSEAAHKLLVEQAPDLSTRKRGRIAIKGKGDMIVYWVGDNELACLPSTATSDGAPTQFNNEKRVEFVSDDNAGAYDEADETCIPVNDNIGRGEVPAKFSNSKTKNNNTYNNTNVKVSRERPEQAPVSAKHYQHRGAPYANNDNKLKTKKPVKEAVHMRRGGNVMA